MAKIEKLEGKFPDLELFPQAEDGAYEYTGPTAFRETTGVVFGPSFDTPHLASLYLQWCVLTHGIAIGSDIDQELRHRLQREYYGWLETISRLPMLPGFRNDGRPEWARSEVADWILDTDDGHEFILLDSLNHIIAGEWTYTTRPTRKEDYVDCATVPVVTIAGEELGHNDSLWEFFWHENLNRETPGQRAAPFFMDKPTDLRLVE